MTFEGWVTIGVLCATLAALMSTRRAPDFILWAALTALMVFPVRQDEGWVLGVISPSEALAGLANPGMVTVGILYIVVAGLRDTGAMVWMAEILLGKPKNATEAQLRVMAPMAGLSAFLNNTPLVAAMLPAITDWSRKIGVPASRLLMPLSFASILGGTCTLIGTSTTLVINGLLIDNLGAEESLGMFTIAWVGVPCAVVGIIYLLIAGRFLMSDRRPALNPDDDARQYTVEMLVSENSPLAGKTIQRAGLRHLPGLYLMEIEREGQVLAAVSSNVTLREHDRLVFAGVVESVVDLQKIRGLTPATNQVYKLDAPRTNRALVEAVVSDTCPLVGQSIREGRFRSVYNAAVIAVARGGERVTEKIGDIVLKPGDTLLMEARSAFTAQQRDSRDFYLVSSVKDSAPPRHEKAWVALLITVAMVGVVATGLLSMLQGALLAGGAMVLTRCTSASAARRQVEWKVLLVIAAAFGLGRAMDNSGAAVEIAHGFLSMVGDDPKWCMAAICIVTMLFTNAMNANAAAVLMFPIALATANSLDVNFMPFAMALIMGAACSFATPIGYQTNLMVYGPGGYRFSDYLRIGGPLSVLVLVIAIELIPRHWPFY